MPEHGRALLHPPGRNRRPAGRRRQRALALRRTAARPALADWLLDTPFLEWLPVREVELQGSQRDLYETVRAAMDSRIQKEIASVGTGMRVRRSSCVPSAQVLAAPKASNTWPSLWRTGAPPRR